MKIAFIGKIASGKSTCCNYLKKLDSSFEITSFAKMVKHIATTLFFMKHKDRVLLQQIGRKMREISPTVFIDYVLHETDDGDKNFLLDDARYINEIETLDLNEWILIKLVISKKLQKQRIIERYPDTYQTHLDRLTHESEMEQELIPDYIYSHIIYVDDLSIEQLYSMLLEIYTKYKKK
tara:strand:- start:684 stop:1220 length:537 start_codon:yes stop_codon:yes gene_type:complete